MIRFSFCVKNLQKRFGKIRRFRLSFSDTFSFIFSFSRKMNFGQNTRPQEPKHRQGVSVTAVMRSNSPNVTSKSFRTFLMSNINKITNSHRYKTTRCSYPKLSTTQRNSTTWICGKELNGRKASCAERLSRKWDCNLEP